MSGTLAIIQARMSSSRFPGKVLQPLLGLPLIVYMARRVRHAELVDDLIVATSVDASDDPLAQVLQEHGVAVFRGDLQDVLDRFYQAARPVSPRYVVRLTGDCPLLDFRLIDGVIRALQASGAAYASNVDPASFPDGLDVECLTFAALERAWREARTASQREHVTPYIRQNTQLFPAVNVTAIADLSALRWTVDYPDDLQLVQELLRQAGARTPADCDRFDFYRVIESNPRLLGANRHPRNEGYAKSLRLERDSPEKS